ncbi:NAD-dependent epimerase/dehydratase family protein [Vibrio tasmaniensis]|uniref:NAD-dependent epimerase/dehydratase family protein n=1 Tax=Vibrio tasmaniensis TaxID=212663 RepID=UPI00107EEE0A|nr:NAD(P)-dependent oxidoreductase [Vibrio tasmaniensis]
MKVLIFGVTGNCGKYTAKHFIENGWKVSGVGRSNKPDGLDEVEFIQGDIQDKELYERLPKNIDLVINFAGVQPSILQTSENTDLEATLGAYVDVNIKGVFNILEYVRINNIKNYIYTTTHRDYEEYWEDSHFLKNNLPPAINNKGDHTMYAITKTSAKMIGDYYSEAFNIRVFNLRLPMIFMIPDQPYYLKDGTPTAMPFLHIIRNAIEGKQLEIWGKPNLKRDYVHIDNLVSLISLCFNSSLDRGTFNVGTGEAVTTERFIKSIGNAFSPNPKETKYIYREDKRTYKCAVYDISETKELLGYEPILLDEMLNRMKFELVRSDSLAQWGWK